MAVVGFNFTKMVAERKAIGSGEVNVQISLNIKDVTKAKLNLADKKQGGLKYNFEFTATYTPDLGYHPSIVTATSAYHYVKFDISGSSMTVTAVDKAGTVIDTFTVNNPATACSPSIFPARPVASACPPSSPAASPSTRRTARVPTVMDLEFIAMLTRLL